MQCRACGAENPQINRFCGMCGTPLERRARLQANGYFSDRSGSEPVLKHEFSAPDASAEMVAVSAPDAEVARIEHRPVEPPATARVAVASAPVAIPPIEVPRSRVEVPVAPPVVIPPIVAPPIATQPVAAPLIAVAPPVKEPVVVKEPVAARRPPEPVFTAGSSMLGLTGDFAPLRSTETTEDGSYLLGEEPHRTVSWRAWALLVVLIGLGVLGWSQWYASHYHQTPDLRKVLEKGRKEWEAATGSTPAEQPEAKPADNATATAAGDTNANPQPAKDDAAQNTAPDNHNPNTNPSDAPDAAPAAVGNAALPAEHGTPTSTPPPAPAKQAAADASNDTPRTPPQAGPATAKAVEKQAPKKVADAAPAPRYAQDPMLLRAQQYIHGRPQNCEMGLNYLRSAAESNPEAQIQMAALYQSGVCVRMDRPQAYHWLSRAQQLDPHNMWLEKSRSQLWANMNAAERVRAGQ